MTDQPKYAIRCSTEEEALKTVNHINKKIQLYIESLQSNMIYPVWIIDEWKIARIAPRCWDKYREISYEEAKKRGLLGKTQEEITADEQMEINEMINEETIENTIDENTSDGYHTFKELYEHRIALFIALMKANPKISYRANNNDDGNWYEWWFVAGIHTSNWDISYHLPNDKRTALDWYGISTTINAPKRDWHTPADVVDRLLMFEPQEETPSEDIRTDCENNKHLFLRNICVDCWISIDNYIKDLQETPSEDIVKKKIRELRNLWKKTLKTHKWCSYEEERCMLTIIDDLNKLLSSK